MASSNAVYQPRRLVPAQREHPQALVDTDTLLSRVPGLTMVTVEIVGTAKWELAAIQDVVERTYRALKPLAS